MMLFVLCLLRSAYHVSPLIFYMYCPTALLLVIAILLAGQAEAAATRALGLVLEGAQHALLSGRPQVCIVKSQKGNLRRICLNNTGEWF